VLAIIADTGFGRLSVFRLPLAFGILPDRQDQTPDGCEAAKNFPIGKTKTTLVGQRMLTGQPRRRRTGEAQAGSKQDKRTGSWDSRRILFGRHEAEFEERPLLRIFFAFAPATVLRAPSHGRGTSVHTQETHADQQLSGARRQRGACLAVTLAGAALGVMSLCPTDPALVWTHSRSVPIGLYSIARAPALRGDIVVISPDASLRDVLDAHDVLPAGKLLLKRLAAASGDLVCREGPSITINGHLTAIARDRTSSGHPLPVWAGCRVLRAHEIFALAPHPASFDSRYFGTIDASQIVGVAHPLFVLPSSLEAT